MKKLMFLIPLILMVGCEDHLVVRNDVFDESKIQYQEVDTSNLKSYADGPANYIFRDARTFEGIITEINKITGVTVVENNKYGYYGDSNFSPYMAIAERCVRESVVFGQPINTKAGVTTEYNLVPSTELTECLKNHLNATVDSIDVLKFKATPLYDIFKEDPVVRPFVNQFKAKSNVTYLDFVTLYSKFVIQDLAKEDERLKHIMQSL